MHHVRRLHTVHYWIAPLNHVLHVATSSPAAPNHVRASSASFISTNPHGTQQMQAATQREGTPLLNLRSPVDVPISQFSLETWSNVSRCNPS